MELKPRVVIGLLGPSLDSGSGADRWERWRPTVSLGQHEDLLLARFEMLVEPKFRKLGERVAEDLRSVSPETQVNLHDIDFGDPWDFERVFAGLHDFASGYPWDTDAEEYLLHITTGSHVAQICLFLLAESRHMPGMLLQTAPPKRKQTTATGSYRVIDLDLSRYDRLAQRFHREQREAAAFLKSGIATRNAAFNAMIDQIEHVAVRSRAPILLTGPTGAGKSQLARRIYELKKLRRQVAGPFVEVNCATIRGDGAMSTLFGHKRGAFTGAVGERAGLLREADGGLLFLDEVGELGIDEQAMLLRALEEKRFLPVGSDREVQSDFGLICGTNRDLQAMFREGRFREDLLARINLWTFCLPGLAERREDIAPNLDYELDRLARRTGTAVRFNKEARDRFLRFAESAEATWPANFRDLGAAVERMATLSLTGRITVETVAVEIERLRQQWTGVDRETLLLSGLLTGDQIVALDPFDRVQLAEVIHTCRRCSSLSEAGRQLFAASRQRRSSRNDADRLRKYLGRFELDWETVQHACSEPR